MERNEFPAGAISAENEGGERLELAVKWPFGHVYNGRYARQDYVSRYVTRVNDAKYVAASTKNRRKYPLVLRSDVIAIFQKRPEDIDLISIGSERSRECSGVAGVPRLLHSPHDRFDR